MILSDLSTVTSGQVTSELTATCAALGAISLAVVVLGPALRTSPETARGAYSGPRRARRLDAVLGVLCVSTLAYLGGVGLGLLLLACESSALRVAQYVVTVLAVLGTLGGVVALMPTLIGSRGGRVRS